MAKFDKNRDGKVDFTEVYATILKLNQYVGMSKK